MEILHFAPDGFIPNNPSLPFVCYRGALNLGSRDAERSIIRHFAGERLGRRLDQRHLPVPALPRHRA